MGSDDVLCGLLLLVSIGFGEVIRRINDAHLKKWTATVLGLSIIGFVSGTHTSHILLVTVFNAIIIRRSPVA